TAPAPGEPAICTPARVVSKRPPLQSGPRLDAQHAFVSRARLLRVPPGYPVVQTLDAHVVELGAVTLTCGPRAPPRRSTRSPLPARFSGDDRLADLGAALGLARGLGQLARGVGRHDLRAPGEHPPESRAPGARAGIERPHVHERSDAVDVSRGVEPVVEHPLEKADA